MFSNDIDFSGQSVLVSLSGGINSMAVLCWLALLPKQLQPSEVHLYYVHFREHSPDTFKFCASGIRYARKHFSKVFVKIDRVSVLSFFESQKMIPHPIVSPCSRELKFEPIQKYIDANAIDFDLIGFVREEKRRIKKQQDRKASVKWDNISHLSNEDCFSLVDTEIGWHPAIYDIRENGKRIFAHNNCLPCKNMDSKNFASVEKHFPAYWAKAQSTANKLGAYWGRLPVLKTNSCDYCLFD